MHIIKAILIFIFLTFTSAAHALTQHEKLWLGIGLVRNLTEDGRWKYLVQSQVRYINESEPWQSLFVEGGIGNVLNNYSTIWAGYRFVERNPANGFNNENRLFEQIVSRFMLNNNNELVYRARFEQMNIKEDSAISLRLRHRLSFSHNEALFYKLEPFLYEEIFTQLNRPSFTPNYFITENRVFIGGNLRLENKQWVEIGYMNQFQMRLRNQTQNRMSHVILVTYNL